MDNAVIADIFKFMTLRAPQNFDHQKDLVTIIRDNRIQDTYLPGETHSVENDETKFSGSPVARFVFDQIKTYLPNVTSNKDVVALNDSIAEDVKNQYTTNEGTQHLWLDDFVSVIKLPGLVVNFY